MFKGKSWYTSSLLILWGLFVCWLYMVFAGTPAISAGDDINSIGAAKGFFENLTHFYTHNNGRLGLHLIRAFVVELVLAFDVSPFGFPWLFTSICSVLVLGAAAVIFCGSITGGYPNQGALLSSLSLLVLAFAILNQSVAEMLFSVSFAGVIYALPIFLFSLHIWLLANNSHGSNLRYFVSLAFFFFAAISSEQMWVSGTIVSLAFITICQNRQNRQIGFARRRLVAIAGLAAFAGAIYLLSPGQRYRSSLLTTSFSIERWIEKLLADLANLYGVPEIIVLGSLVVSALVTAYAICKLMTNPQEQIYKELFFSGLLVMAGLAATGNLVFSNYLPLYAYVYTLFFVTVGLGLSSFLVLKWFFAGIGGRLVLFFRFAVPLFAFIVVLDAYPGFISAVSAGVALREARHDAYARLYVGNEFKHEERVLLNGEPPFFEAPWGVSGLRNWLHEGNQTGTMPQPIYPSFSTATQGGPINASIEIKPLVPKYHLAIDKKGQLRHIRSGMSYSIDPDSRVPSSGTIYLDYPIFQEFISCRSVVTANPNPNGSPLYLAVHEANIQYPQVWAGTVVAGLHVSVKSETPNLRPLRIEYTLVSKDGAPVHGLSRADLPRLVDGRLIRSDEMPGYLRVLVSDVDAGSLPIISAYVRPVFECSSF